MGLSLDMLAGPSRDARQRLKRYATEPKNSLSGATVAAIFRVQRGYF
jgi:hypothetical protein